MVLFAAAAFRFYLLKKDIEAQSITAQRAGKPVAFQSKLTQAAQMLQALAFHFVATPILVVTDSWFGNNGLFRPLSQSEGAFDLLSRLRANTTLYDLPSHCPRPKQAGRSRKYGARLGSTCDLAARCRELARSVSVFLYGKSRTVEAFDQIVVLKNLRCQVRVVWVFRKTRGRSLSSPPTSICRFSRLSNSMAFGFQIESGFKEIKQEIGSSHKPNAQPRCGDCHHLHFCMMATTVTGRSTPIASRLSPTAAIPSTDVAVLLFPMSDDLSPTPLWTPIFLGFGPIFTFPAKILSLPFCCAWLLEGWSGVLAAFWGNF
ncbi:MAG: transposase, partial [Methylococcales bacterium]